jgi:hypothetical protein
MIKLITISVFALGVATSVMAQQSSGNSMLTQSAKPAPSAAGHKNTTIQNGMTTTTVDPGTTGSTANGDSGMPNSNGTSQGCSGSASNSVGTRPGQPASDAPGANCQ